MEEVEEGGAEEEGEDGCEGEAEHHGVGHGGPHPTAGDGEGEEAKDGGCGCHDDGAEARFGGVDDAVDEVGLFIGSELVAGFVDEEDGVVDDDSHEGDETE